MGYDGANQSFDSPGLLGYYLGNADSVLLAGLQRLHMRTEPKPHGPRPVSLLVLVSWSRAARASWILSQWATLRAGPGSRLQR